MPLTQPNHLCLMGKKLSTLTHIRFDNTVTARVGKVTCKTICTIKQRNTAKFTGLGIHLVKYKLYYIETLLIKLFVNVFNVSVNYLSLVLPYLS